MRQKRTFGATAIPGFSASASSSSFLLSSSIAELPHLKSELEVLLSVLEY